MLVSDGPAQLTGEKGMTDADSFLRQMGIPRYDELADEGTPEAEAPAGEAAAKQSNNVIPPALAARPGTAGSTLDNLDELQREAAQLQKMFSVRDSDAVYEGRDSSGLITVNVNGDGQVTGVQIAPSWRDSIGAHGLGAAVMQAVSDATMQRLAAWSTSVAEQSDEATEGPDSSTDAPSSQPSTRPSTMPDNQQARKALQEVLSLLEGVEGALDDFEEQARQQNNQQVVGHGPENSVKVTLAAANQVVDVEVARRFAERAPEGRVSREVLGAFEAAYERASSLNLGSIPDDGPLGKIRTLASDPAKLLNYLGLTDEGTSR